MDKKYLLNHLLRFFSTIVAVLILGFILFHMTGSGESNLSTSVARRISAWHRITGQAYIFRDEAVLTYEGEGSAYSTLSDGQRVMKGGAVASVYAATQEQIAAIKGYDEAISILNRANGKTEGSSVQTDLKNHIAALRVSMEEGDSRDALAARAKLQIFLNLRKRVNGTKSNYDREILDLTAGKEELIAALGQKLETLTAESPGNFYSTADGYEQIFSSLQIDSLTAEALEQLSARQPSKQAGGVAGVLQKSAVWYAALVTNDPAAAEMTVGRSYDVLFGSTTYQMTLHALTPDATRGDTLIVFRSNLIPPEGRPARSCEVSFFSESHEGLMVPTAALRYLKAPEPEEGKTPIPDDTGVYVKEGNKLIFKRVKILCAGEGFYVVKESDPKDEHAKSYLALNDVIVTSGKGLEEGYRN